MTGARPHAQAARGVEGELAVGRGLAHGDLELLGQAVQNRLRALDIAGRAQAHADDVLALGLQNELRVEGGHAVDLAERHAQPVGDELLHLLGKIAKDGLRLLHDGHERALGSLFRVDDGLKLLKFLLILAAVAGH